MRLKCDLHIHSNCSDGELSPRELFDEANNGLFAVSLTDHDTVSGLFEAEQAAASHNLKFLSGIEISSYSNIEVHILGYNIPYRDSCFVEELESVLELRKRRNEEIIRKLRSQGIMLKVGNIFDNGVKGRQHIATLLYEQGYVRSRVEAFDKYIGANRPCFVKSHRITTVQAIDLIRKYEGVAVIAHPMRYSTRIAISAFIDDLVKSGLMGIEVFYPNQSIEDEGFLKKIANKHGIIMTGGSDFHSSSYGSAIGSAPAYLDEKALNTLHLI